MSVENFYLDPILCLRRKGTLDDPYVPITESFTIVEGKVVLSELADRSRKVLVSGGGISGWSEIQKGTPDVSEYKVDYLMGVVYFNPSRNGTSPIFNYFGTGALFIPYSRIYTRSGSTLDVIQTLEDVMYDAMMIANQASEFAHKGNFDPATIYYYRNLVDHNSQLYMCIDESINGIIGIAPISGSSSPEWRLLAGLGSHPDNQNNPHFVTKEQVGLGNVTNQAQIPLSVFTTRGQIIYSAPDTYEPTALNPGFQGNILKMGEQAPFWGGISAEETGSFKKEFLSELPIADETYRGEIRILQGGAGVADVVYMCIKNSSDEYEWKEVTLT